MVVLLIPAIWQARAMAVGERSAYHIELRQFPHNTCHFNLNAQQVNAVVVEPWAREKWIDIGDRKWNPNQARLTVIEGPRIPVDELSMGRGWRTAQRQGRDVTERLLAAARERMGGGDRDAPPGGRVAPEQPGHALSGSPGAAPRPPGTDLLADSVGLELLGALGSKRAALHRAWELAGARHPERTAGECLLLAECAVSSLLRSRLVVLTAQDEDGGEARRLDEDEAQAALRAVESWRDPVSGGVGISRA
jgi:hypothetical protein